MNKIKTFNNSNLKQLRTEINKALMNIEKEFGVQISIGTMRYDDNNVSAKLSLKNENAVVKSQNFPNKGLKFVHGGKTFTVVDYKPRSFKYPYVAVDQKGKRFKFTERAILTNKI